MVRIKNVKKVLLLDEFGDRSVAVLPLDNRAMGVLRGNNIETFDDLYANWDRLGGTDTVRKFRNCGVGVQKQIYNGVVQFYLDHMDDTQQVIYLKALNIINDEQLAYEEIIKEVA